MITFRPFRNSDPPELAELWRSQRPSHGLLQPMSTSMLERCVYAKPYFDQKGLIVAERHGQVVGFVHAGFGPSSDQQKLGTDCGVICLMMTQDTEDARDIRIEMLQHAERYLTDQGATTIQAGCLENHSPFYLGIYGGCQMPGLLLAYPETIEVFREHGYQESAVRVLRQRFLDGFRPPVDRFQLLARRRFEISPSIVTKADSWWDACMYGHLDRVRFELFDRNTGSPCGRATYWDMGPLPGGPGIAAMGLSELHVDEATQVPGAHEFLLATSLHHLSESGVTLVQVMGTHDTTDLFDKLGFDTVCEGVVLVKAVGS
ncbi:MAG: hypothetical protein R3C28_10290 [Pirellulaceae bacterium]